MKNKLYFIFIFLPIVILYWGQACTPMKFNLNKVTEEAQESAIKIYGNGGTYEGMQAKLKILHHYEDNFTCEGRSQPESILIHQIDSTWTLITNSNQKCANRVENSIQNVVYDDVAIVAQYQSKKYIAPRPYFVDQLEDPNLVDSKPMDGVCENINGKCSLAASLQTASEVSSTSDVVVNIPANTYFLTKDLEINMSPEANTVSLRGVDPVTTILDGAAALGYPFLKIAGQSAGNLNIENLSFANTNLLTTPTPQTIYLEQYTGTLNINNCSFLNLQGSPVIYSTAGSGPLNIRKSKFINNRMEAVKVTGAQNVLIEDSYFTGHSIYGLWVNSEANDVLVRNSTFEANGTGINFSKCLNCKIQNSTVFRNTMSGVNIGSSGWGPGGGDVLIENSTIVGNGGSNGQGNISVWFDGPSRKLTINNSVVSFRSGNAQSNCTWPDNGSHTIIANNSFFDDNSCQVIGNGNLYGDPLLDTLKNNGGLTPTMLPLLGSPLIDAADNQLCFGLDQRGLSRNIDKLGGGPKCDIGSVELQ